jgi:hypothetical protein
MITYFQHNRSEIKKMDDFDITAFAKMFDAAIASDNPAVKKALRNFMMIAALAESEKDITGPFESLFNRMDALEREIQSVKSPPSYGSPYSGGFSGYPTYPSYPGTTSVYPDTMRRSDTTTSYSGGQANTSSTSSSTVSETDIVKLLADLKDDSFWSDNDVSSLDQAFKDFNAK